MLKKTIPVLSALAVAISLSSAPATAQMKGEAKPNSFWWPEQLNLHPLRDHSIESNPYGEEFDYEAAFRSINYEELKADIREVLTTSQPWWPADYGHYGPFFVRMSWHSAGTYRIFDGRGGAGGGQQRFEPLNSWPDNVSLDKARRLLWPIKQKYGRALSWADLMVLAGTVGMEDMGFDTYGFAAGRTDDWEPDLVYWGPEEEFLADERHGEDRKLEKPLAAVQMGLIYVNPEGPNGVPDPKLAAKDIRQSFGRMAMNDEEVVALIAGGHTFGKAHGAHKPEECLEAEPAAAPIEQQGFGWKNNCGKGHSEDTITSGLEGAWTVSPAQWTTNYLDNLFNFEWEQTRSPAGAIQWVPKDGQGANMVPDAHIEGKRHQPIMFTTDLALKFDPVYREIAKRFQENPEEFEDAYARAWFKLTHRDMGPRERYIPVELPDEKLIWQDPIPAIDYTLINERDANGIKATILNSGLTVPELVRTAWAAAASYRGTDMRGGINGARIRLDPQINWEVNNPAELKRVLAKLEDIQEDFNKKQSGDKRVSLADVIVLGGAAAVEKAARDAGYNVKVPFTPGRADTTQEWTDVESFAVLEPKADGFRNYYNDEFYLPPVQALVDKADMLELTVPEMTVLVGGLRALDANYKGMDHGVLTTRPGQLTNDFFKNLLTMDTKWAPSDEPGIYVGTDRATGKQQWTATPVDLIFGSNSELRAVAEVYAAQDADQKFVNDFVDAWVKVMQLDRFDLR